MKYKFLKHTADIKFQAFGKNLEDLFSNAGLAMFSVMVDVKKIKTVKSIPIKCCASNIEELLIEWLNSLLTQSSIKEMVFSKFEIKIKDNTLKGKAFGETLNIKKHSIKTEVKAATYSGLFIKKASLKNKNCWRSQ